MWPASALWAIWAPIRSTRPGELVGEIKCVSGMTKTFIRDRPTNQGAVQREPVTVDDAALSMLEFDNGAIGTVEVTRCATGRKNYHVIEVNGSRGSISFNCERLNELQSSSTIRRMSRVFHNVLVTENVHPYGTSRGRRAASWVGGARSSMRCTIFFAPWPRTETSSRWAPRSWMVIATR